MKRRVFIVTCELIVFGVGIAFSALAHANCHQYLVSKSGISKSQLARFDLAIWSDYLFFIKAHGETALFGMNSLPQQIQRLPNSFARVIAESATSNYPELSIAEDRAKDTTSGWFVDLSPRRTVDAIALAHLNPASTIGADLSRGYSCQQSYQRYLDLAQNIFGITVRYDVNDVVKILRALQTWHRAMTTDKTIRSRPNSFYRGIKELVVYGSLPLGKARLDKSDIDVNRIGSKEYFMSDKEGNFFFSLSAMEHELNAYFATSGRKAKIFADVVHFGLDKSHSQLSPIVFRIEDDYITMEVYSGLRSQPEDFEPKIVCRF